MSDVLSTFANSYEEDYKHSLDARLMSYWYRRRVTESASGKSLLELGIGHGQTVNYFSSDFSRHVVIEGAKAVIESFRRKFPGSGCEIVDAYFENYNTSEKFDHISMGFVLEHVADPVALLRRFSAFLAPGGSVFSQKQLEISQMFAGMTAKSPIFA